MTSTLKVGRALREAITEFKRLVNVMSSMHTQFQIRPTDEASFIKHQSSGSPGTVTLECAPVVCRVPERASHSNADLYVVFTGRLEVGLAADGSSTTKAFATNFAYFDVGAARVIHRLGGHYDFSADHLGHPTTHMQLRSQVHYFQHVIDQFPSVDGTLEVLDGMSDVLGHVRTPSAQVDFLGFLLQICADHLLDAHSDEATKNSFRSLMGSCAPVSGIGRPNDGGTCDCAHAVHLYGG